ncbi:sigma-70 family RNA polymerase sigma factor [Pyxidicoccus fallax]|uniref:Sigma-70 family RNA polymerase sigma factor n=1 Tax=Pyxidicoccus fallax TaxID=394095 RepID=A0A848LII5_9BACT|nr:sigma-70 family RNA polymerase sigma factor [Pyxidicoccus fallax]NMO17535.1 sigma-70 family RNA polymerase sigma factor [Pyxidicoccus fallax]NPC81552.1 sigma-70 family RNA polymerase sigma factor [Pyxidicoccus fallax]
MDTDIQSAYLRYFPLIREKCRRMLGDSDEAQDVAQETFLRLWKSGFQTKDPRHATAWIYRTSTNLAVDRLRQRRTVPSEVAVAQMAVERSTAETEVQHRQELELYARHLPPEALEAALLHRLDGLTQQEVAEVLQMSDRTVRRLLLKLDAQVEHLRRTLGT